MELLSGFFESSGRVGRAEYSVRLVAVIALLLVVAVLVSPMAAFAGKYFIGLPLLVCLHVRRLHDLNRSGWWALLFITPGALFVFVPVLMVWPGTRGANNHGPSHSTSPKT